MIKVNIADRCLEASGRKQSNNRSFRPNVQLANDAAEVIILEAKKSGEIGAARSSLASKRSGRIE
jgi:hypothetical protein